MELLDISVPVWPGMVTYPGDPTVRLETVRSIADGAGYNLSRVEMGVHAGTHVDAPLHFIAGGAAVESLALDVLIGPAHVVDAISVEGALTAGVLETLALPLGAARILFKTRNSELWERDTFAEGFAALAEDGARALVGRGVRLVGIDYLSIGDEGAHQALLGAGVVAVEGLDLRGVDPGEYTLVCAPLKLAGAEGAPARVLLIRE
jgi:arylformamidase